MTHPLLLVILCRLPEKGRKEKEEIEEDMKEKDREEGWTETKVEKTEEKKNIPSLPLPAVRIAGLVQL